MESNSMNNEITFEELRDQFYDLKERLSDSIASEEETQEFLNWLADLKKFIRKEIENGNLEATDKLVHADNIERQWRELFGKTLQ